MHNIEREADVLARLTKLECQNCRLRAGLLALTVGFVSLFLTGAMLHQPDNLVEGTVTAHAFVLANPTGSVRAALFVKPDGGPALSFYDASGRRRAVLFMKPDGGAGLGFYDASGNVRTALFLDSQGSAALSYMDGNGQTRATLGLTQDGNSVLGFDDASGKPRAALFVKPDGRPGLSFYDAKGAPRLVLNAGITALHGARVVGQWP